MHRYEHRKDIPQQYTWDLTSLFSSVEEWEREFQEVQRQLPLLCSLQGTLSQSGDALWRVLQQRDEVSHRVERLYTYASLLLDEDTTQGLPQSLVDRISQLIAQISSALSFIEPEILALSQETLNAYFAQTPALAAYEHMLHDLNRKRSHTHSSDVEAILAAFETVGETPSHIFFMLSNADFQPLSLIDEAGEEVVLTERNYQTYIRSKNQRVRKEAFELMHNALLKQQHTRAATLSAQVKVHLFSAQQRAFKTCRESALASSNIPVEVYDNLVATVSEYIPLLNRYLKLRKQFLDLDELHMYDFFAPIVEEVSDEISYSQACEAALDALAPLGIEYVNIARKAINERWIDVYECPGKLSGASTTRLYGSHPFILLNWQNNYQSIYTLMHELGHAIHAYYAQANQPYLYGDYTVFVAEVASTLNEALLTEYLLKQTANHTLRLAILDYSLEKMRSLLFRQALSADFEQQFHRKAEQGEALTADVLSTTYYRLNEKFYGEAAIVDDLIAIEWARIPHLYYNFYVYQYATGIAASNALVEQILHDGPPAVKRYLQFLNSGSSAYSIELLQRAGCDMTTPEPVHRACQHFMTRLAQMEAATLAT